MYGFAGFMSASKKLGLWDCLTWTAGVSGSCWTLAAYYTIASHDVSRLILHYLSVAKEIAHPMSLRALDTVARSSQGIYFLIGPLVRKVQSGSGIIGLGIMDLYATLTTTYQFLSRERGAKLSRSTFQFSKIWVRSGIDKGAEPMPILTAVRRAPKDASGVKPHSDSSMSKGQPPERALTQHQTTASNAINEHWKSPGGNSDPATVQDSGRPYLVDSSLGQGFFQWFEISPLEVGSPDVNAYIPTWAWGRIFVSGRSFGRLPEQSLSLLLGQCTSAPAGPLTGYISALLASLPKGTFMSRLLLLLNDFMRMKRWERFWVNPIRSGHDPNPFYGPNTRRAARSPTSDDKGNTKTQASEGWSTPLNVESSSVKVQAETVAQQTMAGPGSGQVQPVTSGSNFDDERHEERGASISPDFIPSSDEEPTRAWESQGRIRLMDSGMSNNLPSHILARPERNADIIVAFDASSDVQTGSALRRIQNFADDCHITLEDRTALFNPSLGNVRTATDSIAAANTKAESSYARVFHGTRTSGKEMFVIYCPLLPNAVTPSFDPSVSSFSALPCVFECQ